MKPLNFYSFWAINDKLGISKLKRQLLELKSSGFTGVVFHPRNYPDEPEYLGDEYLRILSELILYAKAEGMKFWVYDENGWPSGTAGGRVLKHHPELQCQWLEMSNAHVVFKSKNAVSSLDPEATRHFISITHERYKESLCSEAFDYIEGFFSDEVAFLDGHSISVTSGGIPWTDRLAEQYSQWYGQDLIPLLPLLFIEGTGYQEVRVKYWELLTDALVEGFYLPVSNWCRANGKKFTAHLKAEENPFFQLCYSGSCFRVLENVGVPAVDALERYPGNNYYPRIAHSVSAQFGDGACLVEAMGGAGWGSTPEDFVNYMLWLAGHGLDTFGIHLNQLRLDTKAIKDWPPSLPCHITWKEAFPAVLKEVHEKAGLLPDLTGEAELLIITPTRGVMAEFEPHEAMQMNEHNGTNLPVTKSCTISNKFLALVEGCHQVGIRYEFTEERAVEESGEVGRGCLKIGKRSYRRVLISEGCRLNPKGVNILVAASESGVKLYNHETWEISFDGRPNSADWKKPEAGSWMEVKQTPWEAEAPEENQQLMEFSKPEPGILTSRITIEDGHELGALTLVCMDRVEKALVDGKPLEGEWRDDRHIFQVPEALLRGKGEHLLEIRTVRGGENDPYVFLRGSFAVCSRSPYADRDEKQVRTEGPFVIRPISRIRCDDFIGAGFPFCEKPVKASKEITLEEDIENFRIVFSDLKADALRVYLDGNDLGWCWGPEWTVAFHGLLCRGQHRIDVLLIPNTYNIYGPHHHMDGDRHLTSPAQFEGVKNFADREDAPDITKCGEWSFVRFYIKGELRFQFLRDLA